MTGSQSSNKPSLSLNNVVQVKGGQRVVDHLTLELYPGEVITLLGPNGAGKSSLLELTAGLCKPFSGEVKLGDDPVNRIPSSQRAQRIGFLSQRSEIAWPLAVEVFVGLGRLPHQSRYHHSASEADSEAIENAMIESGVEKLRSRLVSTLSGGELSRVLLARVLAGEPDWLILDEPMTGLDPAHQFALSHLLCKLASQGKGIIVTLHDLSVAAQVSDRIMVLNHGKLVADGSPREVLTASLIKDVYGVRCLIHETENDFSLSLSAHP